MGAGLDFIWAGDLPVQNTNSSGGEVNGEYEKSTQVDNGVKFCYIEDYYK